MTKYQAKKTMAKMQRSQKYQNDFSAPVKLQINKSIFNCKGYIVELIFS